MSETVCHFGKHKGAAMRDIPSGYLQWVIDTIDPVPSPKYCFEEDGVTPLSAEQVKAMEERMRAFISAAEDELVDRETT